VTDETEATDSRPRGAAAWKAARDATEQRNAEAKRRAHEHKATTALAAVEHERSVALAESSELRALNERIVARAAAREELKHEEQGGRGLEP
jgi:hypothetical protein